MDLIKVISSQSISNKMIEERIPKLLMHYCACRSDPTNSEYSMFICCLYLIWYNSTCYFFKHSTLLIFKCIAPLLFPYCV